MHHGDRTIEETFEPKLQRLLTEHRQRQIDTLDDIVMELREQADQLEARAAEGETY